MKRMMHVDYLNILSENPNIDDNILIRSGQSQGKHPR